MLPSLGEDPASSLGPESDKAISISYEPCAEKGRIKVHLSGRIDNYNSVFFQRAMEKIVHEGHTTIALCCSSLTYVSSTGIGSFIYLLKLVERLHGRLVFVGVPAKVYDVFQLLGFTSIFEFATDEREPFGAPARGANQGAAKKPVFPVVFGCPGCKKKLKAPKPGKFICTSCRSRVSLDESGVVALC